MMRRLLAAAQVAVGSLYAFGSPHSFGCHIPLHQNALNGRLVLNPSTLNP